MNIYVAGHCGMVGSALVNKLSTNKNNKIITRTRNELNLLNQNAVSDFFNNNQIDQVYIAAAKVGGICANNNYPAEFIYENLMIECNIIHACHSVDINKILFLGSSCIYPKHATQPIVENSLMSGLLEPTNEPYAIAKIAGIKLCESYNRQYNKDYRSVMPTNLYGPNDNFHPENSHVIPAIMQRIHKAKIRNENKVKIWGTGKPMREFLYVDDMADACIHIANLEKDVYHSNTNTNLSHINIGTGIDCTIEYLSRSISKVVGYKGDIVFDITKPDGSPRKLLDVSLIKSLGWSSKVSLLDGLERTYNWYKNNIDN